MFLNERVVDHGNSTEESKESLLARTREERKKRQEIVAKENSSKIIQKAFRCHLKKNEARLELKKEWIGIVGKKDFRPNRLFQITRLLNFFYNPSEKKKLVTVAFLLLQTHSKYGYDFHTEENTASEWPLHLSKFVVSCFQFISDGLMSREISETKKDLIVVSSFLTSVLDVKFWNYEIVGGIPNEAFRRFLNFIFNLFNKLDVYQFIQKTLIEMHLGEQNATRAKILSSLIHIAVHFVSVSVLVRTNISQKVMLSFENINSIEEKDLRKFVLSLEKRFLFDIMTTPNVISSSEIKSSKYLQQVLIGKSSEKLKDEEEKDERGIQAIFNLVFTALRSGELKAKLEKMGKIHKIPSEIWFTGNFVELINSSSFTSNLNCDQMQTYLSVVSELLSMCDPSFIPGGKNSKLFRKGSLNKGQEETESKVKKNVNIYIDDEDDDYFSDEEEKFLPLQKLSTQFARIFDHSTFGLFAQKAVVGNDDINVLKNYIFKPTEPNSTNSLIISKFLETSKAFPFYVPSMCRFYVTCLQRFIKHRNKCLGSLSFLTPLVPTLWRWMILKTQPKELDMLKSCDYEVWERLILGSREFNDVFNLFLIAYHNVLFLLEDNEFEQSLNPFVNHKECLEFVKLLKKLVFRFTYHDLPDMVCDNSVGLSYKYSSKKVLGELYRRDSGNQFVPTEMWLISEKEDKKWHNEWSELMKNVKFKDKYDQKEVEILPPPPQTITRVMATVPFIVPFKERVKYFRYLVQYDKGLHQAGNYRNEIVIRRTNTIEDGYNAVNKLGARFKQRVVVTYIDEYGEAERGIDLGGPFKEFLETMVKQLFKEDYGLFRSTYSGDFYPNPDMEFIPDYMQEIEFVGRIVGKALYEGILVDVPLASFFVNKILGQPTFLSHLESLDKELYKSLIFLKSYKGDVEDLCLSFTTSESSFGVHKEINLVPNGSEVTVDRINRIHYLFLVADFHLNKKISRQCQVFVQGLSEIINLKWIQMFNVNELKYLISGTPGDIDIVDWKKHTVYDGFFARSVVGWFWSIMEKWSPKDRQAVLQFATGCSRAPLMGFKYLEPRFTIRVVKAVDDDKGFFSRMFSNQPSKANLPTAATCFNMLKLPNYGSKRTLEEKLRVAIESKTGFHLT